MTSADLLALAKALEGDLAAAHVHRAMARDFITRLGEPGGATVVAASLHHYYGALESLTERAMRAFGHALPSGSRWHKELLDLATLELEGTRPALFGRASHDALVELLSFRHFFRHAYAVAWDPARLERNVAIMDRSADHVDDDVRRFVATLVTAASPP